MITFIARQHAIVYLITKYIFNETKKPKPKKQKTSKNTTSKQSIFVAHKNIYVHESRTVFFSANIRR